MVTRRRTSSANPLARIGIAVAILAGGGMLTYGFVRAAGWLDPAKAPLAQQPSREGKVPVPKSLAALSAFDKVQREDIFNLAIGDDSYFWLPRSQVEAHPEWILDVSQIVGRVMARDKRADFVFSEKDFLPEGSRTGIAGGIPAGKQGFFLEAEQIPGLRFLKQGDRFDLLASLPEESENAVAEYGLLLGGMKARGGKAIPVNGVRVLVQNGEMIALTTNRSMTTQGGLELRNTDSRGREITNRREERVLIAIDAAETVPLTRALGDEQTIHMVTRSGQEKEPAPTADALAGMIPFPASAKSINAFTELAASDLAEPLSGELRQYYFKPSDTKDGWIARPEELIGRVVARDIEPGYIFTDDDFLPPDSLISDINAYQTLEGTHLVSGERSRFVGRVVAADISAGRKIDESMLLPPGTRGGVAAGIPRGRMGLTVTEKEIQGLKEFSRGDRFDLIESTSFDVQDALRGVQLSSTVSSVLAGKAINRVVAAAGLVVDASEDAAVIAVRPEEVALITKAIAAKSPLFAITRPASSAVDLPLEPGPDEPATVLTSDSDPLEDVAVTQMIIGGKRSAHAYRRTEGEEAP